MLIKEVKKIGVVLGSLLVLAACNQPAGPAENSEAVLEKMFTQSAKVYESQAKAEFSFSDPETKESGKFNFSAKEKTDASDSENVQSESSFELNGEFKMPQSASTTATEGSENAVGTPEEMAVNAAGKLTMIGEDLYASLNKLELTGNAPEVEQANAILPAILGPYMDETLYLSMETLEKMMQQIQAGTGEPAPDFDALKMYGQSQVYQDLANSKMLVVSEDKGIEKLSTPFGKKVNAYHYEVDLNPEGVEAFLKAMNEKVDLGPQEELDALFAKDANPSVQEIFQLVNEAMNLELWIGQEDYHPYKVQITSDFDQIKAALDKLSQTNETFSPSEEDSEFMEKTDMSVNLVIESQPISSFTLKKPEEVIDLAPLLEMALGGMPMNPSPQDTMTEEEFKALMEGMDAAPGEAQTEGVESQEQPDSEKETPKE